MPRIKTNKTRRTKTTLHDDSLTPLTKRCRILRKLLSWRWYLPWFTRFSEYYLTGKPKSLKELGSLFHKGKKSRVLWITEHSFIIIEGDVYLFDLPLDEHYTRDIFRVQFCSNEFKEDLHYSWFALSVYATTTEEAEKALAFLFGIPDADYKSMCLCPGDLFWNQSFSCPVDASCLAKLKNRYEDISFQNVVFETSEQSRTLATVVSDGKLTFNACTFADGGASFVEAFNAQQGCVSDSSRLTFSASLPFHNGHCVKFLKALKRPKCEKMTLELIEVFLLEDGESEQLAEVEVSSLRLLDCQLGDHGTSLTNSIRAGRGPKGLIIDGGWESTYGPFGTLEDWKSFANALRGAHLERLDLSFWMPDGAEAFIQDFANALQENTSLVSLHMDTSLANTESWVVLVQAVSRHPTLRKLRLPTAEFDDGASFGVQRKERTRAVVEMLKTNQELEEISDDKYDNHDYHLWNSAVLPKLECNRFGKKIRRLGNPELLSSREAVIGRAISEVSAKPSLIWMLLSGNQDAFVNSLE